MIQEAGAGMAVALEAGVAERVGDSTPFNAIVVYRRPSRLTALWSRGVSTICVPYASFAYQLIRYMK